MITWLTPIAAIGLLLTMLNAAATHLRRKENKKVTINIVLLLLALFIILGRLNWI